MLAQTEGKRGQAGFELQPRIAKERQAGAGRALPRTAMPVAGPGVHPLTDLLFHGRHPFPGPVERLILQIHSLDPRAWMEFADAAEAWNRVREDACGRVVEYLDRMLAHLGSGIRQCHPSEAVGTQPSTR